MLRNTDTALLVLLSLVWSHLTSRCTRFKISFRGVQRVCNVTHHGVPVFSDRCLDAYTSIPSNSVGWGGTQSG